MNIRAKSEKGFSLIELLVVVAIIGILAAVGVVGYQGYIDSTKKAVTENNSKAVHQWLLNAKTIRSAGIDVDPSECTTANLSPTTDSATAVAPGGCFAGLGSEGHPFETFKNPYNQSRSGDATILVTPSTAAVVDGTTACADLLAGSEDGDVLVRVSGTVAHIDVYYCAKVDGTSGLLTKMSNTITNF